MASTFNEQLLSRHLMARAAATRSGPFSSIATSTPSAARSSARRCSPNSRSRRTRLAEAGEPLTVERFKAIYRELLERYFGPDFAIDDCLALECFRIPHFYRAFYVYKYATGLSAAIALAERVTSGGPAELNDYLELPARAAARNSRSTCCATRASTWRSPSRSTPP